MTAHSLTIVEVPCDAIRIGDRHRKDLGDLESLASSIATEGLLQPIGITEDNLLVFPVRYTIAHLRVKCAPETAASAAVAAAEMIGRPVSILARPDDTTKFSCTSLACFAYASVGITLGPQTAGRIVPDDLFYSPQVELIRMVFTEGRSERKGVGHAEQQSA